MIEELLEPSRGPQKPKAESSSPVMQYGARSFAGITNSDLCLEIHYNAFARRECQRVGGHFTARDCFK